MLRGTRLGDMVLDAWRIRTGNAQLIEGVNVIEAKEDIKAVKSFQENYSTRINF